MEQNVSAEKKTALNIHYKKLLENLSQKAEALVSAIEQIQEFRQETKFWPHAGKYIEEHLSVGLLHTRYEVKSLLADVKKVSEAIEK